MTFNKKEAEEKFDNFLLIMDDQVENIKEEAEKYNIVLDDSLSDLEKMENLFDLMSISTKEDDVDGLVVFFARHLGEVVRANFGGKWFIQLEDSKSVNFNEPVIIGHCPIKDLDFAPISVMRAYSLRRKKGTLRRAVEADTNPQELDLSDLIED